MGIFDILNKDPLDSEIAKYEKIASLKPTNAGIRNSLGDLYFKKGNTEQAASNYKEAITLFLKERKFDKAIALLKKSITYDLFDGSTYEELIGHLETLGIRKESSALYLLIAKKKADSDRDLAETFLRNVLRLDPGNAEARNYLRLYQMKEVPAQGAMHEPPEEKIPSGTTAVPTSESLKPAASAPPPADSSQRKSEAALQDKGQVKIRIPEKNIPAQQPAPGESATPEKIKDTFLAVAKEKKHLENIILQQNDVIKKIEKEKSVFSQKVRQYAEYIQQLKTKLNNVNAIRDREVSELKTRIETLLREKGELTSRIQSAGDVAALSPATDETEALLAEKQQMEDIIGELRKIMESKDGEIGELVAKNEDLARRSSFASQEIEKLKATMSSLKKNHEELIAAAAASDQERDAALKSLGDSAQRVTELEQDLTVLENARQQIDDERNELRSEVAELNERLHTFSLQSPASDGTRSERIQRYTQEIDALKKDIDELISSLDEQSQHQEHLENKVSHLTSQLENKEFELNEHIPTLIRKIHELSSVMDHKMEEFSLFAKELSDVNDRIGSLTQEIENKDQLLKEISSEYEKEKRLFADIHADTERSQLRLIDENQQLKTEVDGISEQARELREQLDNAQMQNRDILSSLHSRQEASRGSSSLSAELEEKDNLLAEKNIIIARLENDIQSREREFEHVRDGLQEERLAHLAEIKELTDQVSDLRGRLEDVQEQNRERSSAQSSEQILSAKSRELEQKETLLSEQQKTISRLEEELRTAEKFAREREDLHDEIVRISSERDALEERVEDFSGRLDQSVSRIAELEDALASLHADAARKEASHVKNTADLSAELKQKDQLLAEQQGTIARLEQEIRSATEELVRVTTGLEADVTRVSSEKDSLAGRIDDLTRHLDQTLAINRDLEKALSLASQARDSREGELSQTISSLSEAFSRAQDELRARAHEFEEIKETLEKDISRLNSELTSSKESLDARTAAQEDLERENSELAERLSTVMAENETMRSELDRTTRDVQSKEYTISSKEEEISRYAREAVTMKEQLREKEEAIRNTVREKETISQKLSDLEHDLERLGKDKGSEISWIKEQLGTAFLKITDLETRLKWSINENYELRRKFFEGSEERPEEFAREPSQFIASKSTELTPTVPAEGKVYRTESTSRLTYAMVALVAFLIVAGSVILYQQFGAPVGINRDKAGKPVATTAPQTALNYQEMFDVLTHTAQSQTIKLQATLLTKPLLATDEAGKDMSAFDFSRFLYFNVNIHSLSGPLRKEIVDQPADSIRLTVGSETINPLFDEMKDEMRTYYRREEPVSVSFICRFPLNRTLSASPQVGLYFRHEDLSPPLNWDLSSLATERGLL